MATITINDYQIGNNIVTGKDNNFSRYLKVLFGDETELVWQGPINPNAFSKFSDLRKIFIYSEKCDYNGGDNRRYKRTAVTDRESPMYNTIETDLERKRKAGFYGCSPQLQIFTDASSKPETWNDFWDYYDDEHQLTVHWGATRADYEQYQYTL